MVRRRGRVIAGEEDAIGSSGDIECENSVPKRKKKQQKDESEHNTDRFSELPDCLLVEMLSLLPMKEAVRTGILSKRWKSLWTLVDRIRFHCNSFEQLEPFISFADNTLMQCACPNLKEFSLYILERGYIKPETWAIMEKWLGYVSRKNVKILKIKLNESSLRHLGRISWFSLEKLSLCNIYTNDKEIADILSGCPLLNILILENLLYIKHLNIESPKLRKLKLLSFSSHKSEVLEIRAPWLQELEISGVFTGLACRLVDVSSLIFAKVTFHYYSFAYLGCPNDNEKRFARRMATRILGKLLHVEELIVGTLPIQALSVLKLLRARSPLFKCKKLTIESQLVDCDLPGITLLLQISPHLETLIIHLKMLKRWEIDYLDETYNVDGEKYLSMRKGNFQHLKNVRVVDGRSFCPLNCRRKVGLVNCYDIYDSKSYNFQLVEYLLKNAHALQKLVISFQRHNNDMCCERSRDYMLELLSSFCLKLLYTCLCGNDKEAAQWAFKKKQFDSEFTFFGSSSCK